MSEKRISVVGLGYVGAVSTACLAKMGHQVTGVDVVAEKVARLNEGHSSFFEMGLDDAISFALSHQRLRATTDLHQAVLDTDLTFICVGTPSNSSGEVELAHIRAAITAVGGAIADKNTPHIVVMRSTIPPGTARSTVIPLLEKSANTKLGDDLQYVSNPEFLREGSAISDFMEPPLTVVGHQAQWAFDNLEEVYLKISAPLINTEIGIAEILKYADNVWHAIKVTFANEMGDICKSFDIDGYDVMNIFCRDTKLNLSPYYLKPGFAFGGSCLPKDIKALCAVVRQRNIDLPLLNSILPANDRQIDKAADMIMLPGVRRIAVLGIAFKAASDDVRESPMIRLVDRLHRRGYELMLVDENVASSLDKYGDGSELSNQLHGLGSLVTNDLQKALDFAEVVVVGNNHPTFQRVLTEKRDDQVIVDLVRISPQHSHGSYQGICW